MRQASLKLKMYKGAIEIRESESLRKRIFHIMIMSFGALGLCYAIILGNMVMNIVERRSLEKEAVSLSNEVADMELAYLSLSNKIDLDLSYSLGFKEVKPNFATRKSLGLRSSLSQNSLNEI